MPKYFLDTEFIEGFRETCISFPHYWRNEHFINLISIGIVCDDGREYYAVSGEYFYSDADKWVKENVIKPAYAYSVPEDQRDKIDEKNFHKYVGKENGVIAVELLHFFGCKREDFNELEDAVYQAPEGIEVYGYFADYDWVLFCSLFGRMIDLPKGFPMYCLDLVQMMKERGLDRQWKKTHCPDPEDIHNALADAKWNQRLYETILKWDTSPSPMPLSNPVGESERAGL